MCLPLQANRDDCVIDCSALAASLNQSLATAPRATINPRFSIANLGSSHHASASCPPPPAPPRALHQPSSPARKEQPNPHASTYPHADIYPVSATIRDLHQQLSSARANEAQAQQQVSVLAWHVCAAEGTAAAKRNNLQLLRAEFAAASATGASYPGLQRQLDEVQQEAEAAHQQVFNLKHQLQLVKDDAARYTHTVNCLQHHIDEQQQREHQQLQMQQLQQLQQRCRELDVCNSQASLQEASLREQLAAKELELQQERSRSLALQQNLQQNGHFPDALRMSSGDTHSLAAQPPSSTEQTPSPQTSTWQLQQQDAYTAPAREDRPSSPTKVKDLPGRVHAPAADTVAAPTAAEVLKQQIGSAAVVGPKVATIRDFSASDDLASTLPTDQAALQPMQQPDSPEVDASNSNEASPERSNSGLPRPVAFFISSDSFSLGSTAAKSSRSAADSLSANRSRSQPGRSTGGGSSSRTSRPTSTNGKASAVTLKAPPLVTPLLAALAGRPAAAGAPAALIKTTPQGSSTFSFSKAPTASTKSRTQPLDSARSLSCPGLPPSTGQNRGSSSALIMLPQKPSAARGSSISAGGRYANTAESPTSSSSSSSTAQPAVRSTSSTGGGSSAVTGVKLMPSVSQINASGVVGSAAIAGVLPVTARAGIVPVSRPHALAMGLSEPSKQQRQPGDLKPHLQKFETTYAEVIQEWTELKKTMRRGKRTPACRASATNSCDICLRFACPPQCDICYGTCSAKAKA